MQGSHKDRKQLDWSAIRARIGDAKGPALWQSLEELSKTPEFDELLHREFPEHASEWRNDVDRRGFLRLMGASMALAGLGACTTQPLEKIIPYVRPPEQVVPGKPLFFTTAMSISGRAIGLLAESHLGRPTKIEGNPDHPVSRGATDAFAQAAVLSLYDPVRAQVITQYGQIRSWNAFQLALSAESAGFKNSGGRGLRILTETVNSPTLLAQIKELLQLYPEARWHEWEPVNRDNALAGARQALGRPLNVHYRLDRAKVVVSLGSDFLCEPIDGVRYARDFMAGRRLEGGETEMNRLYVIESSVTNTGAAADHRLAVRPSEIASFAQALLDQVGGAQGAQTAGAGDRRRWISALARDLVAHRGVAVVIPGGQQPPEVHALAHRLNGLLGAVGRTVSFTQPTEAEAVEQQESLYQLTQEMAAGQVETLFILGGNPVLTAPANWSFGERMGRVKTIVHLTHYADETSERSHWVIPEAHFLETWSDARASDGTVTIVQPLIAPLFSGRSAHELLSFLTGTLRSGYDLVRAHWQKQRPDDFERFWVQSLNSGVIADTTAPEVQASPAAGAAAMPAAPSPARTGGFELILAPDPTIYDGRFVNNAWLQELPKPITKLTWDNAILMAPATAERLGLASEDLVELEQDGHKVTGPIWIAPGHAEDCATVHLGYGRRIRGGVASRLGFNAYALRTAENPWHSAGWTLRKTGERYPLASTQTHWSLEGRSAVRTAKLAELNSESPGTAHGGSEAEEHPDLYPEYDYSGGNAWGMAIDLTACFGCNACVVACQAENNVPVVGKEQVGRQREMHWLRIDRYYQGSLDNPQILHQPMLCQHCEKAPCEVVCPVAATVHSSEGLNDMVYNRCVGTRYCSNNCPYKVRRFNFLQYTDKDTPSLQLLHNPDVTVRDRGVMEKCTFCVQRISAARIEAVKEDRPIRDGEVVTACQAACPSHAIVFGNINDPNSRVSQLKKSQRNYSVLSELNTQPRTTYLTAVRNPNPEMES